MRLIELSLMRFGPFTDLRLDFGDGGGDLQLIHGANEAGKSTARRAISALLFGIPETTRDHHFHRMPDLRIGARLSGADGTRLAVVRRKGRKDTLLDPNEAPLDDAMLTGWLGGVSREHFENLFGLSHDALVRGGEELVAGRGELAEILFGAGLGIKNLHAILRDLQARAEALFKPGGQKPPLNQALRELREAQRESQRLALRPREWLDLQEQRETAETELVTARQARDRADTEVRRLQRLKRVLPVVGRRAELLAGREALGDTLLLPEDAAAERRDAQRRIEDIQARKRKLQDQAQRLLEERDGLQIPEALLAQGAAIDALRDPLGAYRKALHDLPGLEARAASARQLAGEVLRELGRDCDLEQAEQLRVDAASEARLRALGQQRAGLEAERKGAEKSVSELARRRQTLEDQRQRLPEPRDPDPLRRALAQAHRRGDLEQQAADLAGELEALENRARQRLAALGLWEGPLNRVAELPLAPPPAIERFRNVFQELAEQHRMAEQRRRDHQQTFDQLTTEIADLKAGGPVPTENELEVARQKRDELWLRVRSRWLEGHAGPPAAGELAADYQQAVGEADRLADGLRRDADRTARYGRLVKESERMEVARADQDHILEAINAHRLALDTEWRELWQPAGIDPLPPAEMQAWLSRHDQLIELAGQVDEHRRRFKAVAQDIGEQRERIDRTLAALNEPAGSTEESLGDLLTRSEQIVGALDETERNRAQVLRELEQAARDQQDTDGTLDASRKAMDEWGRQWAEAVRPLGLSPEATVAEEEAVLSALSRLFDQLRQARDQQLRVDQIRLDSRCFAERVSALVDTCAPDLAEQPTDQSADVLLKRLNQARVDHGQRTGLEKRLKDNSAEQADLRRDREAAEAVLTRLMAQAGCPDLHGLEAAEQNSAVLRSIVAKLEDLEQSLAAEGIPLERLVEEAGQLDPDWLPGQIAEAEALHREQAGNCDRLSETIGRLKTQLEAMDGGQLAADAAGRAQEALARIRDNVDQYVRVRLAGLVLQRAMERYREAHQGPLLLRAGEMFQRVTLGAFHGLATGFDERDEAVLQCQAANGDRLLMEGLSEGTRDQLYLALRLASLERHVTANEPLPLVVDDILVNFDDRRSVATLELLGELSTKTQVLFFTHHSRLRDLAREAIPPERLREHDLDRISAAARADGRGP